VSCKKLLTWLLALSVLLAPMTSSASALIEKLLPVTHNATHDLSCHDAAVALPMVAEQETTAVSEPASPVSPVSISHACCITMVGFVADANVVPAIPAAEVRVPAVRVLPVVANPEEIYRPPRFNA